MKHCEKHKKNCRKTLKNIEKIVTNCEMQQRTVKRRQEGVWGGGRERDDGTTHDNTRQRKNTVTLRLSRIQ